MVSFRDSYQRHYKDYKENVEIITTCYLNMNIDTTSLNKKHIASRFGKCLHQAVQL